LLSTTSTGDGSYTTMTGTSMAAPNVTGSVGLLLQHQRNLHGDSLLLASTMKAILLHTADESGNSPGPDYSFGWGLLNALKAAQLMTLDDTDGVRSHIREITLNNGATEEFTVHSRGDQPLKATICWTDPPGTPPARSLNPTASMLVNDLDVRLV